MQTMLRMVGYGDNAGSGFPFIVSTWAQEGWKIPKLLEDTNLNQITLTLMMEAKPEEMDETTQLTTQTTQSTTQTTQSTTQSGLKEGSMDKKEILTDKDLEILNVMKMKPGASQSAIATELDWDMNTVKYYTKKLKKSGLLERTGSSRTGIWVVKI